MDDAGPGCPSIDAPGQSCWQEEEIMTRTGLAIQGVSCESTGSIFRDCGYGSRYYWRGRLGCIRPVLVSEFMGLIWKC
jgi:hypothetical protein